MCVPHARRARDPYAAKPPPTTAHITWHAIGCRMCHFNSTATFESEQHSHRNDETRRDAYGGSGDGDALGSIADLLAEARDELVVAGELFALAGHDGLELRDARRVRRRVGRDERQLHMFIRTTQFILTRMHLNECKFTVSV